MSPLAKLLLPITFLTSLTGNASAAEPSKKTENRPMGIFQVSISDGNLFLAADDASVAQILREISRQAGIVIDSNIGPAERITTRLERVPLEDGIRQLAKNVSVFYAQDPKTHVRRIARVVVLSEVKAPPVQPKAGPQPEKVSEPVRQPVKGDRPQPSEPFKFQFDPSKSGEKESARKQP
jgi:hypothetical protein